MGTLWGIHRGPQGQDLVRGAIMGLDHVFPGGGLVKTAPNLTACLGLAYDDARTPSCASSPIAYPTISTYSAQCLASTSLRLSRRGTDAVGATSRLVRI
jgi:hypothetical protein